MTLSFAIKQYAFHYYVWLPLPKNVFDKTEQAT